MNPPETAAQAQDMVPCTVCREVKCLSPAKVSELMLGFVADMHTRLIEPDLKNHMGLKWTVAHYESLVQSYMAHWGWALRGVCGTCVAVKDPALAELWEAPHYQHFLSCLRWDVLVPEPPAVRVLEVETGQGRLRVAARWERAGLAVVPSTNCFAGGWVIIHAPSGRVLTEKPMELELQAVVVLAERLAGLADWGPYTPETLAADTTLLGRARAEAEAWAASLPRAQPAKEG